MLIDQAYWATKEELLAEDAGWDAGYAGEPLLPTTDRSGYWGGVRARLTDMGLEVAEVDAQVQVLLATSA